jgi:hypothetical protein
MTFYTRATIALFAGVGAGLIGFWAMWQAVWAVAGQHPGIGHDGWLLAGIFAPGVLVAFAVFHILSRDARRIPGHGVSDRVPGPGSSSV